jgi:hypothetical protein
MRRPDRTAEWHYATAFGAAAAGNPDEAIKTLSQLLDSLPPSYVAWTIPIEPLFLSVRTAPGFQQVLARLAERAR